MTFRIYFLLYKKRGLKIHPDGRLLALGGTQGNVHIWDLRENKLVKNLEHSQKVMMNIVDFSPNGYTTVLGSSCSETLSIFDLRNSRVPIGVIESSEDLVQAKFSQTGQTC